VNWDDPGTLLDNHQYRGLGPRQLGWMFTTFHMGHYMPLTWLTFGWDYVMWRCRHGAITWTICFCTPAPR